ncbi:neutral zinc metallopeptidase [Allosalinactinospora lopnorensis]|uniref:neutral zinc metallopeptidase n=1 Tax=Allosalinactinospora lopnorensis TaxID=1352348 RepID=UPI000A842BA8|nr:neutral zinc metallopeptidase [Allosalinactinospora lopnorensis]
MIRDTWRLRGRRVAGSRKALYAGLSALVFALAALGWNAATGTAPEHGPAPGAAGPSAPPGDSRQDGTHDLARPPLAGGDIQRPTGESALVANPLYGTGRLSPLPCPAPDLDVGDSDSVEGFLDTMTDCLDEAWERQFRAAGVPYEPPRRVFWDEPGSSPCRDYPSDAGAFYCRANKSVYIGTEDVVDKWNGAEDSVVYASLLAHEYGHHVQGESGLLEHYHEQRRLQESRIEQNAWTRKAELQANCFAGVFLGAVEVTYPVSGDDRETVLDDASSTADREDSTAEERTHGSAENSVYWLERGMEEQSPGSCNTWDLAEDDLVQ